MFTYAATLEVNPSDVPIALTRAQLWRGLEMKAENPLEFVPGMESCEIVERYADGFLREVVLRGDRLRERIRFTPHIQVHFQRVGIPGWIVNMVSESDRGLLLTFAFAVEFVNVASGSDTERARGASLCANYRKAVDTTLATTRRFVSQKAIV